jgi:hypothetical protein
VTDRTPRRENPWLNLGINVVLPAVVLMKGKGWLEDHWSGSGDGLTLVVFLLALSFPLLYGAYDLAVRRTWNFFSILGLIGVVLTGGIGLLKLPPEWVAIKEATIPGLIGMAVLGSHFMHRPLVKVLLLRPEFIDMQRLDRRVRERGVEPAFDRVLRQCNLLFGGSFFLSAVLNYVLAKLVVVSPAGTDSFNEELGRMTLLSYPVIVLPTMVVTVAALWLMFSRIERLTGLTADQLMAGGKQ